MKNYIKVAAALAFTFGLTGCDLDPVVTDNVTQERHDELIGNPETQPKVAKAALAKVYSIFQDFYDSHDDFGLEGFPYRYRFDVRRRCISELELVPIRLSD